MSQTSNVHFNGGKNMNMFSIDDFFAKKILRIVEYQIEMDVIFSLTRILTSFSKCCLQFKILNKLIFVKKNQPNDSRIGCKFSFSLVELIEIDVDLKEELEKFEEALERLEVMKF